MKPNLTQDELLAARILACYTEPDREPWTCLLIVLTVLTVLFWAWIFY